MAAVPAPVVVVVVTLKLYRLAWVLALVLAAISLLTLRAPDLVAVSDQPLTFDGERAMKSVGTLAADYPLRQAGSPGDKRSLVWLTRQLEASGYEVRSDEFTATVGDREVRLRNIWVVSPGEASGAIVILANRDSPPRATQGADDNASGVAVVLELARVFAATAHEHPIVFLWTDGDRYGGFGAQDFVDRHGDGTLLGAITLRGVGGSTAGRVAMNGWAATPDVAPPWLWVLARASAQVETDLRAPLPFIAGQALRLAVPSGTGSQAPFVSAGIPALALSAPRPGRRPTADTVETVSAQTLGKFGRVTERMVVSIDAGPDPPGGGDVELFFSKYRRLGGGAVTWSLVALSVPLVLFTVALWLSALRRRVPVGVAWLRLALRLAPWVATLLIAYAANLLSLLPHSPGALIPPESDMAQNPRYLRFAVLVLALALGYHYAMAIERRLVRRRPTAIEGTVAVTFTTAAIILLTTLIVNPYSLLLLLPVGVFWPLSRPGPWPRSRLPVWAGLSFVVLAIVYLGLKMRLQWTVWWYFFLLVENRTIPFAPVLLGIALVGATALLGHDLDHAAGPSSSADTKTGGPPAGGPPVDRSRRRARRRTEPQ